jgi:hypothetical protein
VGQDSRAIRVRRSLRPERKQTSKVHQIGMQGKVSRDGLEHSGVFRGLIGLVAILRLGQNRNPTLLFLNLSHNRHTLCHVGLPVKPSGDLMDEALARVPRVFTTYLRTR